MPQRLLHVAQAAEEADKLPRLNRTVVLPLLALATVLLAMITEASYQNAMSILNNFGERSLVRRHVHGALRNLLEAESGLRGYFLTDRTVYAENYEGAARTVRESVAKLEPYFSSEPAFQDTYVEFTSAVDAKLDEMQRLRAAYSEGNGAWREIMQTDAGLKSMRAAVLTGESMLDEVIRRQDTERDLLRNVLLATRLALFFMFAVAVLGVWLLTRKAQAITDLQVEYARHLAGERDKLDREVAARTADLAELARHLQSAREDERSHLARELHDELGALLTAAKLDVARLGRLGAAGAAELPQRLDHLKRTLDQGVALKRRIIEDLRPSALSNLGLQAALEILAREFGERSGLALETEIEPVSLSPSAQIAMYRLVQESLTNIAKYAKARTVRIALREERGRALLRVQDDGVGFDPATVGVGRHGLMGMRFRAEAEQGGLTVNSRPGAGTVIEVWMPVEAEAPLPDSAAASSATV